jgi:hypothetical protein
VLDQGLPSVQGMALTEGGCGRSLVSALTQDVEQVPIAKGMSRGNGLVRMKTESEKASERAGEGEGKRETNTQRDRQAQSGMQADPHIHIYTHTEREREQKHVPGMIQQWLIIIRHGDTEQYHKLTYVTPSRASSHRLGKC